MGEISYRSIFPNNNIPHEEFQIKSIDIKEELREELREELSSLIDHVDLSQISAKIFQLEFKLQVEEDPVNALLQQLKEKSKTDDNIEM